MFTIIIATCDRPDRLVFALATVIKAINVSGEDHRIIVVDNGVKLSARKVTSECDYHVDYLESEPYNKTVALNAGINAAKTDWLVFTDDDTLPDKNWLREGEKFLNESGSRLFGGRVISGRGVGARRGEQGGVKGEMRGESLSADYADGDDGRGGNARLPGWLRAGRSGRVPRGPAVVTYEPMSESGVLGAKTAVPLGANFFVHQSVFEKCGNYDEQLWQSCGAVALGCEDAEFSMRVRTAGEKIGYCHEAVVVHPVYPERISVKEHLRWAYRNGVRETILFKGERLSMMRLLKCAVITGMKAVVSVLQRDSAGAVCDLMSVAQALGVKRGEGRCLRHR